MPQQPLPHPRRRANHHRHLALALLATGALVRLVPNPLDAARAQQATTLNGPPVQVVPYVAEPGVPMVTINPGTPNPLPSPDGATGNGADGDGGVTGEGADSDDSSH